MRKINLKGISEILSEKELKNVTGGCAGGDCPCNCYCNTDANCSGECPKCVPIGNWNGNVCARN